jgi:diacylglycerol kinase family enzyme
VRLLLIVNVRAHAVTPRKIRFIREALATRADVRVVRTEAPDHARELAAEAAAGAADVVATLGGDGTVNEAVNGLAGGPTPLGIIPGGGTNVLARSLGIPRDPVRAAGHLLARLGGPARPVNLGRAGGRYFTFSCGIGLDAEIVAAVERRQALKKAAGHGYFVYSAARIGLLDHPRRASRLVVRWGEDLAHRRDERSLAIVQNTRPFTYLGDRPMHVCPRANIRLGLDCFAPGPAGRARLLRIALRTFTNARHTEDERDLSLHDEPRISIEASEAATVQMDGEVVGRFERLDLESVRDALYLLA